MSSQTTIIFSTRPDLVCVLWCMCATAIRVARPAPAPLQCGFVSAKFDTFLDLSLEIPTRAQAQRASIELRVYALSIFFVPLSESFVLSLLSGQRLCSEQTHVFPLNADTHSFSWGSTQQLLCILHPAPINNTHAKLFVSIRSALVSLAHSHTLTHTHTRTLTLSLTPHLSRRRNVPLHVTCPPSGGWLSSLLGWVGLGGGGGAEATIEGVCRRCRRVCYVDAAGFFDAWLFAASFAFSCCYFAILLFCYFCYFCYFCFVDLVCFRL